MPINRSIRELPMRPGILEARISGKNFTRDKINEIVNKMMNRYSHKRFQVILPYESWKPGNWFSQGMSVSLFTLFDHYDDSQMPDGGDPETYEEFIVYISNPLPPVGGCTSEDNHNDCLYRCLLIVYGTRSRLPPSIKTPELLKKNLNLQRDDPIPINGIIIVEELAGTITINVSGDYTYKSKRKCKRVINLILTNGHYSIAKNPDRKRLTAWYSVPKVPLIYEKDGVKNIVTFYDGIKYWKGTVAELRKLKSNRWSGKWCFINKNKTKTLEETFIQFNEECNSLLEKSKKIGLPIDLKLCCGSYKIAALWLFERLSQGVPANEQLDPIEAQWLLNAMKGGIIWANNNWKGYGRQYDYTSLYPYLLTKYFFPIGKGEFKTLQSIYYENRGQKFIYYGLYHAEVEYQEGMTKLFRYNSTNIYTHHDLTRATELGLNITYSKTVPNALIYESKKNYPGSVMFGAYVEMLFNIKLEKGPAGIAAKRILNMLWGALCEKMKTFYEIGNNTKWTIDNRFEVKEGESINHVIPMGKDNWTVQCSRPDNLFKGEYPRVAPFLLAIGRKMISETIQPYKDCLKRVHTDGFILEETIHEKLIQITDNAHITMGLLKFEKEGICHVKNANQVKWN